MQTTSTLLRVLASIAVVGTLSGLTVSACIYHDTEIKLAGPGHLWCGQAVGAQVWNEPTVDEEDLLVPNLDTPPDDDFPIGCECISEHNNQHEDMKEWVNNPPHPQHDDHVKYEILMQRVKDAVLEKCSESRLQQPYVQFLYDNCPAVSDAADVFELPNPTGDPNCEWVGDHPLHGDAGTGDTGGPPPPAVDPSREITCTAQGECSISTALAVAFRTELLELANEQDGYGEFVVDGLQLKSVSSSDVIYLLGFRTNDVIVLVNRYNLRDLAEVETAMLSLLDETEFEIDLKRQDAAGAWIDLMYEYTID